MKKGWLILSLFIGLSGCKDIPYGEAGAEKYYSFSGIVELGTPVSGATVSAYEFADLRQGKKIAEAISGPEGTFALNLRTNYDGPLLLAAKGGLYRDLTTGEKTALKPYQQLRSAITHIKMPEKANVNAWTTMAVARVLADRGYWDKSVAELKDVDRINVDFSQMSYFLTGKAPNFVNIRLQEFFDIGKDAYKADDPKVTLHLAHGGLSRLARGLSAQLAEEGVIVSVVDLVSALADDLSDRIFDGRNASGNVVFVGRSHRINLNSYTMRKNLSEAILLYAQHLKSLGKLNDEDAHYLERPLKLIDSIAHQVQPEMFPNDETPKPIDRDPPVVQVHFAKEHSRERQFAYLSGNVMFELEVQDDSPIHEIKLLEPKITATSSGNIIGPISVDLQPQAMQAAEVCGKVNELKAEIKKRELNEDNIVCACFEAVDMLGNAQKEMSCFQRQTFKVIINSPSEGSVLSARDFGEGIRIKANVTNGLAINKCMWRIEADQETTVEENVLPKGNGQVQGAACIIDDVLDETKFFNGSYVLIVDAEDVAGRIIHDEKDGIYQSTIRFQVYKEQPFIEISKPVNNEYLAVTAINIGGKVGNPEKIESIKCEIMGIDKINEGISLADFVVLNRENGQWQTIIGKKLPAGRYSLDVHVTDIYGNQSSTAPRIFTLDFKNPVIVGALDGIPQTPYQQETTGYRSRLVDDGINKPLYVMDPVEQRVIINWGQVPRIYRWLTRVDDIQTAPSYTFKVNDDNGVKEIRYKLNYKCSSLEETDNRAYLQDDRYEIRLNQNAASFDLTRDSEVDGHTQKYCLSVWAIDNAGNATNHNVEFIWKVVVPSVEVD